MTEFEKVSIQLIRYLEWATTKSGRRKLKLDGDACRKMIRVIEVMIADTELPAIESVHVTGNYNDG